MSEYTDRIAAAQKLMREEGIDALCLSVGSDLPTSPATKQCRWSG